jgi:hypothetical protein
MGLVDYSSSSEDEAQPPPSKRRKHQNDSSESNMPPLPAAFHDLYAATVRQSVGDAPSLHQGRKRLNPHVPGNWPTHLYVECMSPKTPTPLCPFSFMYRILTACKGHPTSKQHDTLATLIHKAQEELGEDTQLHSFLTSHLGADLPLHISLSRPLSLSTSVKDEYLSRVEDGIRNSGIGAFFVRPSGLAWYKSPDSDRTFFVLRVVSTSKESSSGGEKLLKASTNPELMKLLTRSNTAAVHFGHPPLYEKTQGEAADMAFHISIGWTMGALDEKTGLAILKFFGIPEFEDMSTWSVEINGVKAKIGNVVSHISLLEKGKTVKEDVRSLDSLYG